MDFEPVNQRRANEALAHVLSAATFLGAIDRTQRPTTSNAIKTMADQLEIISLVLLQLGATRIQPED